MVMASLISTSAPLCSTSTSTKSALYPLPSSSFIPYHKAPQFGLSASIALPGLGPFSQWSGLKHLDISTPPRFLRKERKRRCKGKVIHASLFGVGAPEALVIGVVALLVFGPKGLAEVARNLGKTLRAFQPTIKELQVGGVKGIQEHLEREIGLDEISNQTQNTYNSKIRNTASTPSSAGSTNISTSVADPNGAPSPNKSYTSEEYLKMTEEQLKASAAKQQEQPPPPAESQLEPQAQPQPQETTKAMPPPEKLENEAQNS
ncbi:sec-independent protein translocase protein TATB [Populus alba x Populus x berolinensis]|uniref:Sec-independent protein translocase protein TATB n=1 Tax=Populus alba x Populus x berolinensis TaxID=444605 RepID=A0AAD6LQE6_9ROSI|nr:sec-independent protein translocase protein TATB [Populus alba x Populus x berolinensis]